VKQAFGAANAAVLEFGPRIAHRSAGLSLAIDAVRAMGID
jgi:hypothetical protein